MRRPALLAALLAAGLLTHPAAAQTAAPKGEALPADLLGSYGAEPTDCTESESEGRVHVTAKTLEFADSKLTFTRISRQRDGWWKVEGLSREAGKRTTRRVSLELRLKDRETLSLRSDPQKIENFGRCRPAQLQG